MSQESFCRHMFHRNLLGVLDPPPPFPATLVTESSATCADPRSGSWFGRMPERSRLTGCEPNSLIEISSDHTPTNFPRRKNSFSTDINDVPTTVAPSDIAETIEAGELTSPLVRKERESSSKLQPATASIIKCGKYFCKRLMLEASGN